MYLLKILSRQFCGIKVQEGIRNVSDPLRLFVLKYAVLSDKSVFFSYFMEGVYQPVTVFKRM